jgi:hypothetical protein
MGLGTNLSDFEMVSDLFKIVKTHILFKLRFVIFYCDFIAGHKDV